MSSYYTELMEKISKKYQYEAEFLQAVSEVTHSIDGIFEHFPHYVYLKVLERMVEPERIIMFRVPWVDDQQEVQVNTGFRVEMNSTLGPYKGGLRFHPSVNLSIIKFLAFEQVFKNSLTSLPLGGGKGGADFNPKGKSDFEVMRFCQSFMNELYRHIGPDTDVPAGDIGVGSREIGFLFGQYKKLKNEFTGSITGKGTQWGGSLLRPEATGYGVVYFGAHMLDTKDTSFERKKCLVSGSGNVAQFTIEKILELGGKAVTVSDSNGFIYDEEGISHERLEFIKELKNFRRGRIKEYADKYKSAVYTPVGPEQKATALWEIEADCAFPCATENEIGEKEANALVNNNIIIVVEGANMPCTAEAVDIFEDSGVLFGPAKAANAGGVAVSGLEMTQNSTRMSWSKDDVDRKLRHIMKDIHRVCLAMAAKYGRPHSYIVGANIAGFIKVADSMVDQGVI